MVKVEEVDEALIDTVCSRIWEHLPAEQAEQCRELRPPVLPLGRARRRGRAQPARPLRRRALALRTSPSEREPGETKVRVYNPEFDADGWQSTHTAVEIVTDDMPFLVDSVSMELNRRGCGRPRDHPPGRQRAPRHDRASCVEMLPPRRRADAEYSVAESVIHAEVDRADRPGDLDELTEHLERVIARGARRGRGLAGDARAGASRSPRASMPSPLPIEHGRGRRGQGVPRAGWPTTTSPSSATATTSSSSEDGELRLVSVPDSGLGILRQPGGSADLARLRPAAARRARAGARAVPAQPDEGQLALDDPPRRLPRLRRRQALRRRRPRDRASAASSASTRTTAYHAQPERDPDPAPQGRARSSRAPPSRPAATTRRR